MNENISEADPGKRARRRHRRRLSLAFAVSVAVALLATDSYLKSLPHLGFYLAGARWVAYTDQFDGFWRALEETDTAARLQGETHSPLQQWQLAAHEAMGVRPTPARWSAWFGRSLVVAGRDDGIGVCLRPGLLLRAVDFLSRLRGKASKSNGVSRHGDWFYAWRNGYLLASRSASAVVSLRKSGSVLERAALPEKRTAGLRWFSGRDGEIILTPEDGLPVRGWIAGESPDGNREAPAAVPDGPAAPRDGLAEFLSKPPLLTMAGTASEELSGLVFYALKCVPVYELVYQVVERSSRALPEGWAAPGLPFEFALTAVDTTEALAVPEMAYLTAALAPGYLRPLPPEAVQHEWGAFAGWIRPWAGEKLSVCAASDGAIQLITSQEPLMAELARAFANADPSARPSGELRLTLDWERCSGLVEELLLEAAGRELIRRRNREDVEAQYLPYLEMFRVLGALRLEGVFRDSRLDFKGYVAEVEAPTRSR
ncbi:MAG: hypothetical protein QGG73_10060 [Candidatus Hydrogenedentes bacterium]|nr:hypothetical protein [Candidatus Hydrogenedentota bacterium]